MIQRGGQIPRTDTIFSPFEICNTEMCNIALFLTALSDDERPI